MFFLLANIIKYKHLRETKTCFFNLFSTMKKLLLKMNSDRQTNKTLVAQLSQRISGKDDYSWSSSGNSRSTQGHLQDILLVKGPSPSPFLFPLLISLFSLILVASSLHLILLSNSGIHFHMKAEREEKATCSVLLFLSVSMEIMCGVSIVQFPEWMEWSCFGFFLQT